MQEGLEDGELGAEGGLVGGGEGGAVGSVGGGEGGAGLEGGEADAAAGGHFGGLCRRWGRLMPCKGKMLFIVEGHRCRRRYIDAPS